MEKILCQAFFVCLTRLLKICYTAYMDKMPTVVAISSPLGTGGIAVVRISGFKTLRVLDKLIISKPCPMEWETRRLYNVRMRTHGFEESGMCAYFKCPHSYTGEDMAEIYVHGSMAIAEGIVRAAIAAGAIHAGRGEFTMRAYLNGKMDLTQAEGVSDLINSETDAQIRAAQSLVSGDLFKEISDIQDNIRKILARIEASIDYPEENLEEVTSGETKNVILELKSRLRKLISTFNTGYLIRAGVKVAIIGKPNAGKSTLFNALLGYDRAIVNERAGTTRDTIEDSYVYSGIKFTLIDTAGLREAADEIEAEGVRRSADAAQKADLTVEVADAATLKSQLSANGGIKVLNKCDLLPKEKLRLRNKFDLLISAKTGQGINPLKNLIYKKTVTTEKIPAVMLTNTRQYSAALAAHKALEQAFTALDTTLDCVSIELLSAYKVLGQITGKVATDDVIKQIFEDFCVGK